MLSRIENPYSNEANGWLRGNLHAHTINSDGVREPQEVVDAYAALSYDFLMFSDHDFVTPVDSLDSRGMALLQGNEVTAAGPHLLHVGAERKVQPDRDRQRVVNEIRQDGGFAIVNHPNWERHYGHCSQVDLEAWSGYAGIEIYNGVVRRLQGSPLATDRWDRLLGGGRFVWGYANDDSHAPCDDGIAWNMVQSPSRDAGSIAKSLREGRFYASTGVWIESIRVEDDTVRIETRNAQRIVVHSDYGHREAAVDGPRIAYALPHDPWMRYVRFECWGPGESMAWTQPFRIRG